MNTRHPLETAALADLDADAAAYDAHLETTLDLGPFGPYRNTGDFDVLHGLRTRPEIDAAEAAAADALLPF